MLYVVDITITRLVPFVLKVKHSAPVVYSQKQIRMLYKRYFNVQKVADIMGCSKETVYLAIRK